MIIVFNIVVLGMLVVEVQFNVVVKNVVEKLVQGDNVIQVSVVVKKVEVMYSVVVVMV